MAERGTNPETFTTWGQDHESVLFDIPQLEKQMGILTVLVNQEMRQDPSLRTILEEFIAEPLSESLPHTFFERLRPVNNPRLNDLLNRYQTSLEPFLGVPSVPDELIVPDIRHAPWPIPAGDPHEPEGRAGVTDKQRTMIGTRYVMARYIKRLALGAELLNHPEVVRSADTESETPHGVKLRFDAATDEERKTLANPSLWQTNKQLKDRVYEITAGDQKYILKERKTSRHLHVKKGGHVPGLTSAEEYATARAFEASGAVQEDDVRVRFESPVGYADFPDGYSFVIFRHEPDLWPDGTLYEIQDIVNTFSHLISERPEQYQNEFAELAPLVEATSKSKLLFDVPLDISTDPGGPPSFEEYAEARALFDMHRARFLQEYAIANNGFTNSDLDGRAYRLFRGTSTKRPQLELLGFDFEYFKKNERVEDRQAMHERMNRREVDRQLFGSRELKLYFSMEPETNAVIFYLLLLAKTYPEMLPYLAKKRSEDKEYKLVL